MDISRTRRNFRTILGGLLILSCVFFMGMAGLYGALKMRYVKMLDIAPTLFQIDILQHQAKAVFSDQDGKLHIAEKMIRNSLFSPIYAGAGLVMLEDLAKAGHAPSQTRQADLMLRFTPDKKDEAIAYYRSAAAQDYIPAQEKLAALEKLAQNKD
jgi:hypothetical protein